jgi:hypothetical protein
VRTNVSAVAMLASRSQLQAIWVAATVSWLIKRIPGLRQPIVFDLLQTGAPGERCQCREELAAVASLGVRRVGIATLQISSTFGG